MGVTTNGLPLIGRYPSRPDLTLAACFNGNGFSWVVITGQIIADLLTGRPTPFTLTPFNPDRFAMLGTTWRNPSTAGENGDVSTPAADA